MTNRSNDYLNSLVIELSKLSNETEWVEFKHNNKDPQMIGEYISALSNSAALHGKPTAYMVWGIDDATHEIIGTTFRFSKAKKGNEELESWILRLLEPKIDFEVHELTIQEKPVVVLEISAAFRHPVTFSGVEYIRVGSHKKKLKGFKEKERKLWRVFDKTPFENQVALENIPESEVLGYLDYPKYFELLSTPLPESRTAILETLESDKIIQKKVNANYDIMNLGAILFARDLSKFNNLKRKPIRIIQYRDNTKLETIKEITSETGYAVGFEKIIQDINSILPSNEVITQALRKNHTMYPELAIREVVANAIIHQDFFQTGTSVMVELFANRFEVTNPGNPLVETDRFLDSPPQSRNEAFASFMRRIGVCEERGSGIDKVVVQTEMYQLPAPIFETIDNYTKVILFAHKELKDMDKSDKIRACYLHASLRYIQRDYMTNSTLRERFGIEEKNRSMVSKIISDTITAKKIAIYDESVGSRARKYIPWWTK